MKKLFILSFFILTSLLMLGQNWIFSSTVISGETPAIAYIQVDQEKNMYIASYFRSMSQPLSLSSNGYNDVFIAKYDSNATFLWIKSFGGNNPFPSPPEYIGHIEQINDLLIDPIGGCLYISGFFYNSVQFGSITLNSYTSNSMCRFILKMSLNGDVIWVKRFSSSNVNIAIDNATNLYVAGGAGSNIFIDTLNISSGCSFICKINSSGDLIWTKKISNWSGPFYDLVPTSIKIKNNNIYINGNTGNDTIRIDTISRIVPINTKWSFLTRFDATGNAKWLSLYGGNNPQSGYDFSVDDIGNSYSTGYYTGTGYFVADTLISNAGQKNMFLAKHDSMGQIVWVKQVNATSSYGTCVSNVVDSIIYVTGWFKGTARFADSVVAGSSQDMFLAKYDSEGVCLNVNHFGKAVGSYTLQDNNHDAYVSGIFSSIVTIGSNTFTPSGDDIFFAKLSGDTFVSNPMRLNSTNNLLTIYANPNTGKCNITIPEEFQNEKNLVLNIFDIKGNQVQQAKVEMLEGKIKLDIEAEAKGIYTAVLTNGKKNYTGQIIFE